MSIQFMNSISCDMEVCVFVCFFGVKSALIARPFRLCLSSPWVISVTRGNDFTGPIRELYGLPPSQ